MCGIAGKVGSARVSEAEILRMCDAIAHRGPDDWGTFVEGGLGPRHAPAQHHRPRRRPPADGQRRRQRGRRLQRRDLQLSRACTRSWSPKGTASAPAADTEVLVHLYEEHGEKMVARLRGMFAFAIWDRTRQRLLLARDHFGQKPLFYTESGGKLTFASEIKALLADDPSLAELSPRALDQYLTMRFVHPPETFFARVRQLPAGALHGLGERPRPDRALLGPELRSQVDLLRGGDAGAHRRAAGGDGQAAPAERCAGGRVSERRAGLHADRLLCRADARLRAADVLDGHSLSRPQRAALCRGRGGSLRHPSLRRGGHPQRGGRSAAAGVGAGRAGRPALHLPAAPGPDDRPPREGRARRRRRRRAVRRLRPLCGRPLARRLPGGAGGHPEPGGQPGAPPAARPVHLQERHPQAPLGGPDGAEDRRRALLGEPAVLLVQRGAPERAVRSGLPRSAARHPARRLPARPLRRPERRGADRPDDVRGLDVPAAGPVAHDPRPGDDGVQPRVALAVPGSAVRRVHGPGARPRSRSEAGGCATWSAGWASAICRPKCCAGRSRGSPRR